MIFALNKKGFTLMELLVAIAIFGILSTFIVAGYRGNEKTRELKNQGDLLVAALQQAQSMALAGTLFENQLPLGYVVTIPNCQDNCVYIYGPKISDSDAGENLKIVPFNKVKIDIVKREEIGGPSEPGEVIVSLFSLPRGNLSLYGGGEYSAVWIELTHAQDNNLVGCLEINSVSGRISLFSGTCASHYGG